jgi:hypothetical protein
VAARNPRVVAPVKDLTIIISRLPSFPNIPPDRYTTRNKERRRNLQMHLCSGMHTLVDPALRIMENFSSQSFEPSPATPSLFNSFSSSHFMTLFSEWWVIIVYETPRWFQVKQELQGGLTPHRTYHDFHLDQLSDGPIMLDAACQNRISTQCRPHAVVGDLVTVPPSTLLLRLCQAHESWTVRLHTSTRIRRLLQASTAEPSSSQTVRPRLLLAAIHAFAATTRYLDTSSPCDHRDIPPSLSLPGPFPIASTG